MICTEFYEGQGLGNQLWAYAVTRLIADSKGCEFSILSPERFKGKAFIELDFGSKLQGTGEMPNDRLPKGIQNYYREKNEIFQNCDMWPYDEDLFSIPENTKVDGNFQSYQYLRGKEELVRSWIKVRTDYSTDKCVIHFRHGDFRFTDVYLSTDYFDTAMRRMNELVPGIQFVGVSDEPTKIPFMIPCIGSKGEDPHKASHHLGGDISVDFSYLMTAKYVIIPNSSFSWWATFLNPNKPLVIAPLYWAGRNKGFWQTKDIKTDSFIYV